MRQKRLFGMAGEEACGARLFALLPLLSPYVLRMHHLQATRYTTLEASESYSESFRVVRAGSAAMAAAENGRVTQRF